MEEIGIVKDVFRNKPHVVISRGSDGIKAMPLTAYGEQIAKNSTVSSIISGKSMPDGFVFTGFMPQTPSTRSILKKSLNNASSISMENEAKLRYATSGKPKTLTKREKSLTYEFSSGQKPKAHGQFSSAKSKSNSIDYRAMAFRSTCKVSLAINPIKFGKFGFDQKKSVFTSRSGNPLSEFSREKAESSIGSSTMRRFFAKNSLITSPKSSRRAQRRAKTLSPGVLYSESAPTRIKDRISNSIFARLYRNV